MSLIRPLLLVIAAVVTGCTTGGSAPSPSPDASGGGGERPACPTSQPAPLAAGERRIVTVETSAGSFEITVEADLSPIATGNFVALAACGFYDGVVFHRLVPGFVIQGGDPTGTGTGGPGYTISDEPVTAAYGRGSVAMARTPAPDSQGSQFFIVLDDAAATALSSFNTYAILGTVTGGMEAVDSIAAGPNSGPPNNTALDPVAMDRVTVSSP